MKRELLPYYISRAALSVLLGLFLASNITLWIGVLMGTLTFVAFVWYTHSGRYLIDTSHPLTPLRRDERGNDFRNQAAVIAVAVGGVIYGILSLLRQVLPLSSNMGAWALILGVITYFAVNNWLYIRG